MPIRVLPADVVNQIAAGEVVERPAHLVKELIENALDAAATEIDIDIESGGKSVRVNDNGTGIAPSELVGAVTPHATSKIQNSFDLWNLSSFGFRGEALASLASVSRLTLTSRTKQDDSAHRLTCTFGARSEIDAVGGRVGTTVQVEDLFANVPARLKFLKSEAAELTQIKNIVKAMGFANPQVQFRLQTNGKPNSLWFQESQKSRVQRLLDLDEIFESEQTVDENRVRVFVSPPHKTFGTTRNMWFFAQGRFVQDRTLQAAVMDAYRGLLMHGEYPLVVIMVNVPPEDIDVNIHPTKSQIKFLDAAKIFRLVQKTVRGVLEPAPWLPARFSESAATSPSVAQALMQASQAALAAPTFSGPEFSRVQFAAKSQELVKSQWLHSPPIMTSKKTWTSGQIVGQLRLTYIVMQTEHKLILIDQHAAHERVVYERLMAAWAQGPSDVQKFLLPLTLDLEPAHAEALIQHQSELSRFGVEMDLLSPTCLSIASGPTLLSETALVYGLQKMAREAFEQGSSFAFERGIADVLATMACHSVVRAGQALSFEQMHELLAAMEEFSLSSFCPHGRPVWIEWTFDFIEREFGRVS